MKLTTLIAGAVLVGSVSAWSWPFSRHKESHDHTQTVHGRVIAENEELYVVAKPGVTEKTYMESALDGPTDELLDAALRLSGWVNGFFRRGKDTTAEFINQRVEDMERAGHKAGAKIATGYSQFTEGAKTVVQEGAETLMGGAEKVKSKVEHAGSEFQHSTLKPAMREASKKGRAFTRTVEEMRENIPGQIKEKFADAGEKAGHAHAHLADKVKEKAEAYADYAKEREQDAEEYARHAHRDQDRREWRQKGHAVKEEAYAGMKDTYDDWKGSAENWVDYLKRRFMSGLENLHLVERDPTLQEKVSASLRDLAEKVGVLENRKESPEKIKDYIKRGLHNIRQEL